MLTALLPLLLDAAAYAQVIDIPLRCQAYDIRQLSGPHVGYGAARLSTQPPSNSLHLPQFGEAKPVFGTFRLANTEFVLAMTSPNFGGGYDCVYLDYDGDGNLAEEQPLVPASITTAKGMKRLNFPLVNVAYRLGGSTMIYTIWPYADLPAGVVDLNATDDATLSRYVRFGFAVACAWEGTFTAARKEYKIRLWDLNANGRFDNVMTWETSDLMALEEEGAPQRLFYTGDLLSLGKRLYRFEINVQESRAQLVPVEEPLVELKLRENTVALQLISEDETHCIMMADADSTVMVPPGSYRLVSYMLRRLHANGEWWTVSAAATSPRFRPAPGVDEPPAAVAAGEAAALQFGEPFRPVVKVSLDDTKRKAGLSLYVLGSGGESLLWVRRKPLGPVPEGVRDPSLPPAPLFRIVTANGENVAEGKMEYG